jgi:hypothetical protein
MTSVNNPPLLLLSSGATRQYLEDVVRALALPDGGHIQFRYESSLLAPEVIARFDSEGLAGRICYLAYLDNRQRGKTPEIVPVREAVARKVEKLGDIYIFYMDVKRYIQTREIIDQKLLEKLAQDRLPSWKPNYENDPKHPIEGFWVNFLSERFPNPLLLSHDLSKRSHLDAFKNSADVLVKHGDFDDLRPFFNVLGIREANVLGIRDAAGAEVSFSNNEWDLAPNQEYALEVYHYYPGERVETDRRVRWLSFRAIGGLLAVLGRQDIRIDSAYDVKTIRLVTYTNTQNTSGALQVYLASNRRDDQDATATLTFDVQVQTASGAQAHKIDWGPLVGIPHQTIPDIGQKRITVERLSIRNFKNIRDISLDFGRPSTQPGRWNCIAGINGSGKSSMLQALCLGLLGERLAIEFGRKRLAEWLRADGDEATTEILITCRVGDDEQELYLPLSAQGVDEVKLLRRADYGAMRQLWKALEDRLVLSYGASRNISELRETRHSGVSNAVQRQMTLFDPLTQIASVEVLLQGGNDAAPIIRLLVPLLRIVLGESGVIDRQDQLVFDRDGFKLGPLSLPDGFRSSVAWLADLCATWCDLQENPSRPLSLTDIHGVVMVDEIDLHLHASLQRLFIPNLRKALPNVQFIVTTHSPIMLSCFDRNELIVLDRNAAGGIRELDRQLFGMSMDDIYYWLMGTKPESPVIEKLLEKIDPDQVAERLLAQSSDVSEQMAVDIVATRKALLRRLATEMNASPGDGDAESETNR